MLRDCYTFTCNYDVCGVHKHLKINDVYFVRERLLLNVNVCVCVCTRAIYESDLKRSRATFSARSRIRDRLRRLVFAFSRKVNET